MCSHWCPSNPLLHGEQRGRERGRSNGKQFPVLLYHCLGGSTCWYPVPIALASAWQGWGCRSPAQSSGSPEVQHLAQGTRLPLGRLLSLSLDRTVLKADPMLPQELMLARPLKYPNISVLFAVRAVQMSGVSGDKLCRFLPLPAILSRFHYLPFVEAVIYCILQPCNL